MKQIIIVTCALGLLTGCSTSTVNYRMLAYDANGKILGPRMNFTDTSLKMVNKSKMMFCRMNPKSVVHITDPATGKDIEGLSPYQCP